MTGPLSNIRILM